MNSKVGVLLPSLFCREIGFTFYKRIHLKCCTFTAKVAGTSTSSNFFSKSTVVTSSSVDLSDPRKIEWRGVCDVSGFLDE